VSEENKEIRSEANEAIKGDENERMKTVGEDNILRPQLTTQRV